MRGIQSARFRSIGWGVVLFVVAGAIGCGSKPMGKVSGVVTVGGKPMPHGTISFVGSEGEPQSAGVIDGKYETDDMPVGTYKVMVLVRDVPPGGGGEAKPVAEGPTTIGAGLGAGDLTRPAAPTAKKVTIDPKFGNPEKSGLSTDVKAGPNTYSPDLK